MNISKTLVPTLIITSPTHDQTNLGMLSINEHEVITTDFENIKGFHKYYLGQNGEKIVVKYLNLFNKLKRDISKARFAVVFAEKIDYAIGIIVEYDNGTFLMHNLFADVENFEKDDVERIAASYIAAESINKKIDRLKSWEEIDAGATIKEAFTSSKTNTGLWGQEVPIVNSDCNMCLSCILQCPDVSIDKNPITNLAELTDPTKCKSCGICVEVCNKDAVELVDKNMVKAARDNVFSGKYGKRIEVEGDNVEHELIALKSLSNEEYKSRGYEILYKELVGDKSLSGNIIAQYKYSENEERPSIITFVFDEVIGWKKISRPYAHLLVYGFSDFDLELATKLQIEGYYISCLPSTDPTYNTMRSKFEVAGYTSTTLLEEDINTNGDKYDAVITAYHRNLDKETYFKISEKIGVFLSPFMKNFSRDKILDNIINEIEAKMVGFTNPHHDEDRPLGKVLCQESDICSGHRACTGCPIESTFDMAMKAVREAYDTEEEKIEIVNSGATGCAEVVTTIYPDTSWKKYLHTVFGGLGANLEGMNAAYRFLKKTGKITKTFKFFGWAGDGATYDIGLQSLSGYLERGLATDSIYLCYDNGAYMNTGVQRSSATPMGAATSTTPIGEVIRGKMQFRKNLAEFAKAHEGVYVATVSISSEMDFKRKLQKAAKHDGPSLVIAYSNCTTGHVTGTSLTVAQSKLAVDSGYWPLFEIENGEKKITHEPSFIRKYEATKQKIEKKQIAGKETRDVLIKELEESKKAYQDEFTSGLANWLRSEGRFALHFDKKGNLKNEQSVALLLHLYEELKIDWNKLRQSDRLNKQKEKLISVLEEYIHEKDIEERKNLINNEADLFGVKVNNIGILDDYINNKSLFDTSGTALKSSLHHIILNIKRQLDPEVYTALYNNELKQYKLKKPALNDNLRALGACLYTNYFEDQLNKLSIEQKAFVHEEHEVEIIKERIKHVENIAYSFEMEEVEKQKNRAILGQLPVPGRIFARAGDGGVTSAKMFVSLMRQIGIFGKAAPDYGPERRGAPVGTNFQLGGKELKTQASYDKLDISIVKNPADQGWNDSEWRNTINDGGLLVINSKLSVDQCRVIYNIPATIKVYVFDATKLKEAHRVPETITLMGGMMRAFIDMGISFEKDYLNEKWEMLLNKEFASKANREKIVEKNILCFWEAFNEIKTDFDQKVDVKPFRDALKIEGYEPQTPEKLMTGSEAVAEAWRQINPGVFAMFPITPSTEVGQEFSKFWADGKVDTEYIHTESEHSSFMTIIAAAACG
ncbi:MAG: thiamine pyrophosphate-dependent enzyme, partial [Cyclobacteriaceae bacterium]|nr:thiamine pyrophosphate-dependent enzyme [Cyclobacteriaceae bacterium]